MKRRPKLSQVFVQSILDYDPATGVLTWKHRADRPKNWNTKYAGKPAGSSVKGYIQVQIEKVNYYAHQLAWVHFHGEWPNDQIDHRNGRRDANWIKNLRKADNSRNGCNKAMQRNNVSGFVGVHFDTQSGRWWGAINLAGKRVWRRHFDTREEAAAARAAALPTYHGEFARDH